MSPYTWHFKLRVKIFYARQNDTNPNDTIIQKNKGVGLLLRGF